MDLRTCVSPDGTFVYGIHKSRFKVKNLRGKSALSFLGQFQDGRPIDNRDNFPEGDVDESQADDVFEIPNPFAFKGSTFITRHFADRNAKNPGGIAIEPPPEVSLSKVIGQWTGNGDLSEKEMADLYQRLPEPLQLAIATTSTDPRELACMAGLICRFVDDDAGKNPVGRVYRAGGAGNPEPMIDNYPLFKALANNPHLPDEYKKVMVLTPGAQGDSPIVGEYKTPAGDSHVFEYLRKNSYIPWGHYAANMADDAVRYNIRDLTSADMAGMRHLYYQRTYLRMADSLGLPVPSGNSLLKAAALENLREKVHAAVLALPAETPPVFNNTLWGWNFGFDYAPTGYRLHGSHQQIHQQYSLIPAAVSAGRSEGSERASMPAYACGDLIGAFVRDYRRQTGRGFFDCYIRAIGNNRRMDGNPNGKKRLVVHEDDRVMLFVPKAQTSQWELQLMPLAPVGNILEAGTKTRNALDRAILVAVKVLSAMGATMITTIEYAKRFDNPDRDQRLLYCFLPRLPASPGAFSEAQLRWISRHYPEDFAAACRDRLASMNNQ